MKPPAVILVLICAFSFSASALPQLSDEELEKLSEAAMQKTKAHAGELVKELLPHATAAEAKTAQLESSIKILSVNNVDLDRQLKAAETSAKAVEQYGDAQAARANAEQARADKAQKLADHRGNILGWLGAAAGCFLALQLMKIIPMPYALAAPVLGGGLGYLAARLLL